MKARMVRNGVLLLSAVVCTGAAWAQMEVPASAQPTPTTTGQRSQAALGAQDSTGGPMPDPQPMEDKIFVRAASEGGVAEVEFGKLALAKSNDSGVKEFAQRMVDDHTLMNTKMEPIARSMGVTSPKHLNKADQAEYDKLNGLAGADFDKEYITFMLKDHRKDLHEFRRAAATAGQQDLKDAAENGTKVIWEHLKMVEKLARANGIATPGPMRPGPAA